MSKKKHRRLGHFTKEITEFVDQDYLDDLPDEAFEYIKKFNRGYYDHDYKDNDVFPDADEAARDANRRENAARNDAYAVARKSGDLKYLATNPEAQIADVSTTDLDWEEYYKIHGYKLTLERLLSEACADIDGGIVRTRTVLLRFYAKREKLRRLHLGDQRASRDNKKRGAND